MSARPRALAALIALVLAPAAQAAPEPPLAIRGGTVLPVSAPPIERGIVLVGSDGKIAAVGGPDLPIPPGARVIEAAGKFVMPGIIDTHSHMGVYPWAIARGNADGNEATDPVTSDVRAEDAIYLDDPAFARARAGGVTTALVIPGSANLVGGEGRVLKLRPANTLAGMVFEGAPRQLKMAMGENPKRVYGSRGRRPETRMGSFAVLRESFRQAIEYHERRAEWERARVANRGVPPYPRPAYDPRLETLWDVVEGKVRLQVHCYTKTDILGLLRLADEFHLKIAAIHHALEAYKVAPELAARGIGVCTWADWWGFKMEAWDAIPENAALCAKAGCRVAIHSDSSDGVQRLWHDAAKCVATGMSEADALRAVTLSPASILGIDGRTGSLEAGKDADIAIFSRHPFDALARVEMTLIDGKVVYEAAKADAELEARLAKDRAAPPAPIVAIRGARVVRVSAPPIDDGTIVLADGRIAAVGPSATTPVPAGAEVIEGKGLVAAPGLIDALSRVGLVEVEADESEHEDDEGSRLIVPHLRVTDGLNPESETVRVARIAGVTTAAIAPAEGDLVAGRAAVIDLAGRTVGDMVVRDPFAVCVNLGNEPIGRGRGRNEFGTRMGLMAALRETLVEAQEYRRRLARYEEERAAWERRAARIRARATAQGATLTATPAGAAPKQDDDEPGLPPSPPDRKLKYEALIPVIEGREAVIVRAHRETDIRAALALADEFGLKIILNHATEAYRLADLLAKRGVPVILGPVTTQPDGFESWNAIYENAALLARAGVKFAIQTGSAHNARKIRFEAEIAATYGLPPDAALRAITLGAAEVLGIEKDYGSLDAGKVANLVLFDGDPLAPRSRVVKVFIRGREVPMESHQTELRDRFEGR
jgi:imidazolonepropionase-like amidohydrolase